MGLRFTLSHPVTAAIPPGDETLFRQALGLALRFTPLKDDEARAIKEKGLATAPLFTYPELGVGSGLGTRRLGARGWGLEAEVEASASTDRRGYRRPPNQ